MSHASFASSVGVEAQHRVGRQRHVGRAVERALGPVVERRAAGPGGSARSRRPSCGARSCGQTTRARPRSAQIVCSVLPRPMSSASTAPRPASRRNASQSTPCALVGAQRRRSRSSGSGARGMRSKPSISGGEPRRAPRRRGVLERLAQPRRARESAVGPTFVVARRARRADRPRARRAARASRAGSGAQPPPSRGTSVAARPARRA